MQLTLSKSKGLSGSGYHQDPSSPSFLDAHLFVNLCKLFQVVLKKGDLLLLGMNPPTVLGLHFCTLVRCKGEKMWLSQGQTNPTGDNRPENPEKGGQYGLVGLEDGTYFLDSSRDVLNEQLAKVVEGLEFPGLQRIMQNWGHVDTRSTFPSTITETGSQWTTYSPWVSHSERTE